MKGIILAGGKGSRLFPATAVFSKHLLPVFDKPMIYYSLAMLISAGVDEILLVVSPENLNAYRQLLEDGSHLGISIQYQIQPEPRGIGQALALAEDFVEGGPVCVILGDNLFLGQEPSVENFRFLDGCTVFGCPVANPGEYGVAEMDEQRKIISIEEKPALPKSGIAITGLYLFDGQVCGIAKTMTESARGEFEICDILNEYLACGQLHLRILEDETTWIDAGTPDRILSASMLVRSIQEKTKKRIGCPEEAAWQQGFISSGALSALAWKQGDTEYGQYLQSLIEGEAS